MKITILFLNKNVQKKCSRVFHFPLENWWWKIPVRVFKIGSRVFQLYSCKFKDLTEGRYQETQSHISDTRPDVMIRGCIFDRLFKHWSLVERISQGSEHDVSKSHKISLLLIIYLTLTIKTYKSCLSLKIATFNKHANQCQWSYKTLFFYNSSTKMKQIIKTER